MLYLFGSDHGQIMVSPGKHTCKWIADGGNLQGAVQDLCHDCCRIVRTGFDDVEIATEMCVGVSISEKRPIPRSVDGMDRSSESSTLLIYHANNGSWQGNSEGDRVRNDNYACRFDRFAK